MLLSPFCHRTLQASKLPLGYSLAASPGPAMQIITCWRGTSQVRASHSTNSITSHLAINSALEVYNCCINSSPCRMHRVSERFRHPRYTFCVSVISPSAPMTLGFSHCFVPDGSDVVAVDPGHVNSAIHDDLIRHPFIKGRIPDILKFSCTLRCLGCQMSIHPRIVRESYGVEKWQSLVEVVPEVS